MTTSNHVLFVYEKGSLNLSNNKVCDVFHIPHVKQNLLSVGRITDLVHIELFNSKNCYVFDKKNSRRFLL